LTPRETLLWLRENNCPMMAEMMEQEIAAQEARQPKPIPMGGMTEQLLSGESKEKLKRESALSILRKVDWDKPRNS
jgi:hypothetical protein